jgi:outer membrane lipoprotein-sorting protein
MTAMKRLIVPLVLLLVASASLAGDEAAAEDSPDPIEILKKVDAAIKAVSAVSYTAKSTPSGIAVNFVSPAEGSAVLVGWNEAWGMPEKFRVHLETTPPGSDEQVELTGGGDGDMFFLIDHTSKKVYEDMDPNVLGSSGNTLQAFGMREFVHSHPFDDEIGAETVKYEGVETVGGEECHKIFIDYGQGGQKSTWLFGTSDYLPRRRVQHFTIPEQGDGTLAIEVTKLEINPEIDPSVFRLVRPEGFEQIDDFAP